MRSVSPFESNLLHLLGYFLGREPPGRVLPFLEARLPLPAGLSENAVALVKDALAKGCVALLARRGGWRRERHLRGDRIAEGRLLERTPPRDLGLRFSRETLAFLVWLTAQRLGDGDRAWQPEEATLAVGDLVLLFFAHEGLRGLSEGPGAASFRARAPVAQHGLCQLAYPEDFPPGPGFRPNFAPWTDGVGACIMEALQPELAGRWVAVESGKGHMADPAAMLALGASQERVLTGFLDAADRAGRWDLARFLLQAGSRLFGPSATPEMWVGKLHLSGLALAERAEVYRAALALAQAFDRLRAWARRARGTGRFDDGYQAAQLWKADWERYEGDALCERARALGRRLDPLRQG